MWDRHASAPALDVLRHRRSEPREIRIADTDTTGMTRYAACHGVLHR